MPRPPLIDAPLTTKRSLHTHHPNPPPFTLAVPFLTLAFPAYYCVGSAHSALPPSSLSPSSLATALTRPILHCPGGQSVRFDICLYLSPNHIPEEGRNIAPVLVKEFYVNAIRNCTHLHSPHTAHCTQHANTQTHKHTNIQGKYSLSLCLSVSVSLCLCLSLPLFFSYFKSAVHSL